VVWLEINHGSDEKWFTGQHGRPAVSMVRLPNVWVSVSFCIGNCSLSQESLIQMRRKNMGLWGKVKCRI